MPSEAYILTENHVLFGKEGRPISQSMYKSLSEEHKSLFLTQREYILKRGSKSRLISEMGAGPMEVDWVNPEEDEDWDEVDPEEEWEDEEDEDNF